MLVALWQICCVELWVFLTDSKGSHQSASSLRHRWRNTLWKEVEGAEDEGNLTNGGPKSGLRWSDGRSSFCGRRLAQELTCLRAQLVAPFPVAFLEKYADS